MNPHRRRATTPPGSRDFMMNLCDILCPIFVPSPVLVFWAPQKNAQVSGNGIVVQFYVNFLRFFIPIPTLSLAPVFFHKNWQHKFWIKHLFNNVVDASLLLFTRFFFRFFIR